MQDKTRKKGSIVKRIIFLSIILFILFLLQKALHRPSFDPDTVAKAETSMWKAYYKRDKKALGVELIKLQRNQFGLNLYNAVFIARDLGKAAMKFRDARSNHEKNVLPDLISAYSRIQKKSGYDFDPKEAARAELAWWVARRSNVQNNPEVVGAKIAHLYEILYGKSSPHFYKAGRFRAQAAAMRDQGGESADWLAVENMLKESYRELSKAVPESPIR